MDAPAEYPSAGRVSDDEHSRRAASFGAAARAYAEHRPDYPLAAIRWALEPAAGQAGHPVRILDLGAGTGKLTAQLAGLARDGLAAPSPALWRCGAPTSPSETAPSRPPPPSPLPLLPRRGPPPVAGRSAPACALPPPRPRARGGASPPSQAGEHTSELQSLP